jgi:hypothetical protein
VQEPLAIFYLSGVQKHRKKLRQSIWQTSEMGEKEGIFYQAYGKE